MTNKEIIITILKKYPCLTGSQIHNFAKRLFNIDITPQSAAGVLRPLVDRGLVGKSPDPNTGRMVYWFTSFGKEQFK